MEEWYAKSECSPDDKTALCFDFSTRYSCFLSALIRERGQWHFSFDIYLKAVETSCPVTVKQLMLRLCGNSSWVGLLKLQEKRHFWSDLDTLKGQFTHITKKQILAYL